MSVAVGEQFTKPVRVYRQLEKPTGCGRKGMHTWGEEEKKTNSTINITTSVHDGQRA